MLDQTAGLGNLQHDHRHQSQGKRFHIQIYRKCNQPERSLNGGMNTTAQTSTKDSNAA